MPLKKKEKAIVDAAIQKAITGKQIPIMKLGDISRAVEDAYLANEDVEQAAIDATERAMMGTVDAILNRVWYSLPGIREAFRKLNGKDITNTLVDCDWLAVFSHSGSYYGVREHVIPSGQADGFEVVEC